MRKQILALDPATYERHPLHGGERLWTETNCYVDVWVELLHAWGFDPVAALPFTLALDFEGDQWSFFKFPHEDLYRLYGLEVQELNVWRALADHVEEQVGRGRPVLVELDSYHLPDTAGTAYRREHVKSTAAVVAIDLPGRRLGYFHGQGYYHLEGEDFSVLFRLDGPRDPAVLPPFTEFVKRRERALEGQDLTRVSAALLRERLRRVPEENPFVEFRTRFESDLPALASGGLEAFHAYSFATLRQVGAACELAATYLDWLGSRTGRRLDRPATSLMSLARGAKSLQFQAARAVVRGKPLVLSPLEEMAEVWKSIFGELKDAFS